MTGDHALPLNLAVSIPQRTRGLLFEEPSGTMLLLAPCNDVHTVGMRHRIDVAFVDGGGRVIEAHRDVGPRRRLRNRRAVAVLERFSTCDTPWLRPGEQLGIVGMEGFES